MRKYDDEFERAAVKKIHRERRSDVMDECVVELLPQVSDSGGFMRGRVDGVQESQQMLRLCHIAGQNAGDAQRYCQLKLVNA